MAVTLNDIAKACGVSRGTVDRALNGKGRINPETKEKVLSVAKDMGYKPDLIARSLVKGQSMCIGVIVFDILNRYFAQMVNAIGVEARDNGYSIEFMLQEGNPALEIQLIDTLLGRRIDGIILCPVNKGDDFAEFLANLSVPVIAIGNKLNDEIPYIGIDEYSAAAEATRLIISKQYQRAVFVCPSMRNATTNLYSHERRLEGFLSVISQQSDIGYYTIDHPNYLDAAYVLLARENKRTAFFCSGDIFAIELMNYLRKRNMYAPMDYGIMGFDKIDTLQYVTPELATVYNPMEQIGIASFRNIIKLIHGHKIENQIIMPYQVIHGETL